MQIGRSPGGAAAPRPRIGITGKDLAQLANYVEAVEAAGGEAVPLLPDGGGSPDGTLDGLDGLVLSGGDDIDPAAYGQEVRGELGVVLDHPRDELEIPLARSALEQDVPVLGICRGVQVLNVAAGGSLYQDMRLTGLPSESHQQRRHTPRPPDDAVVHEVVITPASRLAQIVGNGRLGVNTFHHQVIDKPAPQFAVSANAADANGAGVIEALEAPDRSFAVGVQWHPERMWKREPACARLFTALVDAARRRRGR